MKVSRMAALESGTTDAHFRQVGFDVVPVPAQRRKSRKSR
jgi:hypothetical protein